MKTVVECVSNSLGRVSGWSLPLACGLALTTFYTALHGQIRRTEAPVGDSVKRALAKGSLTAEGARSFHVRMDVSEPENPQSPYGGSVEEWWISPNEWRREVTAKSGMKQTIVVVDGKKTEKDEGDYFPRWLRSFVTAMIDPIPNAGEWAKSDLMIQQITLPNGDKSDACARTQSKIGNGVRATDAFSNICFDGDGRLKFYGSPSYSMEFHDYRNFGKKQIARTLSDDPEPGTKLMGRVTVLEEKWKSDDSTNPFVPLLQDDNRFESAQVSSDQLELLSASAPPIVWPPVHSGNVKGQLAVYVAADSTGQVREAWPLNSDNAGLEDPVREQVLKWKIKPAVDSAGNPVQLEGGLGFHFETRIEDPLPVLEDTEARALATRIVDPVWPPNSASGQVFQVDIGVNERGQLTGTSFGGDVPTAVALALNSALRQWTFQPLIRNGKAQYFHGIVKFAVP